MFFKKKSAYVLSFLGMFLLSMVSAQAAMVSTPEVLSQEERARLETLLEREDVQNQLMALGVDAEQALDRVDQLTDEEVAQINGKLAELPVGAGVSTVELLLIIILLVLIL